MILFTSFNHSFKQKHKFAEKRPRKKLDLGYLLKRIFYKIDRQINKYLGGTLFLCNVFPF